VQEIKKEGDLAFLAKVLKREYLLPWTSPKSGYTSMSKGPAQHVGHSNLEEFKKFLVPLSAPYSDAQLQQLRREMHAMAQLLLNICLGSSEGCKRIDSRHSGVTLRGERSKNELPLG
jgi:hypothetical protein